MQRDAASPLWAVTTYFNPAGYRSRLRNFHAFRRHLGVPLLAVELSFDGRFELQAGDVELLLRREGADVMWQKERLLNGAWAALPAHCEAVAWIDCDTVFCDADWPAQALALLQRHPVIHALRTLHHLPPGTALDDLHKARAAATSVQHSVLLQGAAAPEAGPLAGVLTRADGAPTPGIAWAARRHWIQRQRLFDAGVVGGGDTAFAAALLGRPGDAVALHGMNTAQQRSYLPWAARLQRALGDAEPGLLPTDALHLWHGELRNRQSAARHALLGRSGFDPQRDLRADGDGPWRWRDPQGPLAGAVRDYFIARREDGDA